MAHPRTSGARMPNIIEQIRACLDDPDHNGVSRRHIGGKAKRERLAAIASNLGVEAVPQPGVGHILALLFEKLEIGIVNKILSQGPGNNYKGEWDKWELAQGKPTWERKGGEERIRKLIYDLLMPDLKMLYNGYRDEQGQQVKHMSVRDVCKKVEDEIGLVAIKESHFREQLKNNGVLLRNVKGEPGQSKERNSRSMDSPSTAGAQTPGPAEHMHNSPQPRYTGRSSPGSSRLPLPVRTSSVSHAPVGRSSPPNLSATTQGSSQYQASQQTDFTNQDCLDGRDIYNLDTYQQHDLPGGGNSLPSSAVDPNIGFASLSGHEMYGVTDDLQDTQPIPDSFHSMPFVNTNFGNENSPLPQSAVDSYDSSSFGYSNALTTLPLAGFPAETDAKNILTQLVENMQTMSTNMQAMSHRLEEESTARAILTRRLDTESTARKQLEDRANEVDKLQKEYKQRGEMFEDLGKMYEELTSQNQVQYQQISALIQQCKDLERERLNEKAKREKLDEDMESLLQRYYGMDAKIKQLENDKGALESKVLELTSLNRMADERVDQLQNGLRKLQAKNSDLKEDLNLLQGENDTLRANVTKLNEKLDDANTKARDHAKKLNNQVGTLQQQKCGLEKEVAKLQSENSHLASHAAKLQEAKDKISDSVIFLESETTSLEIQVTQLKRDKEALCRKVELLETETASLQRENQCIRTKTQKEPQDRLSSCSLDSAIGESPRTSIASSSLSSRKRQISITEERDEKRHRSMDCGTFLMDAEAEGEQEELPIAQMSKLPIRSSSREEMV